MRRFRNKPGLKCQWMAVGVILLVSAVLAAPVMESGHYAAEQMTFSQPLWHLAPTDLSGDSASNSSAETPLHHFDLPCTACHESADQKHEDWHVTGDINRACTTSACHDYDPVLNHPLDVAVPTGVPGYMPLGSITCVTCHVPAAGGTLRASDQQRPGGVLLSPEVDICASCHQQMNAVGSKRVHWRFSTKAHLGNIKLPDSTASSSGTPFGYIDDESLACLDCHEDITVTIPGENESRQERVARWAIMKDHPIGMNYRVTAAGGTVFFNYPVPATDHVRLFDERVGCGSCHSLYAGGRTHFTVADRGDLCRKCHIR
ncbi:MAG: hypothetical protein IH624_01035 [Phycisphaerae bacterium]|nr:hypothetical protein [Phycisphaerae bacterium]